METQKIRIGNDIRLAVDLRQYIDPSDSNYLLERNVYNPKDQKFENNDADPFVNNSEVYYPGTSTNSGSTGSNYLEEFLPDTTPIGIRSVKAFLINTSKIEEREKAIKKASRFISRFPIEPYIEPFCSTEYDVRNSGYPTYRAYPHHHMALPYHGYGVCPRWDGIYKPLPMHNDVEYMADVIATKDQNVVEISFPAEAQLYTGKYKLVIVAKVFAPGYNHQNLKTITVDIPDVIELVSKTAESDSDIIATAGRVIDILDTTANRRQNTHYVVDNILYTT